MNASGSTSSARLRSLLADVLELLELRLELAAVEAREDLGQVLVLLVQAMLALMLAGFGLIFLAVFVTVLLWDAQRYAVLGGFAGLFLLGGLVFALLARRRLRRGLRLFRSSRDELRRDRERLQA